MHYTRTRQEVQYIALLVEKSSTSTATVRVRTPPSHNVRRFLTLVGVYKKWQKHTQNFLIHAKNYYLVPKISYYCYYLEYNAIPQRSIMLVLVVLLRYMCIARMDFNPLSALL